MTAMKDDIIGPLLIPLVEMIRVGTEFGGKLNVQQYFDPVRQAFVVRATKDIKKGTELLLDDPQTDRDRMLKHGFFLDNNFEHNAVDISFGLTAEFGEFPKRAEKVAMLPAEDLKLQEF